ncbi:MAG TPA: metallophosphoesterase [Gemmataceae bacterium]|nr:metallophosphoesterase [Gemmataceae bacterium]
MAAVKLAFTSDLHLPITKDELISALGREVQAFAAQALVVAGDMGESLADVKRGLQLLREQVRCPIWVLAGNHDVWARPPYDSRQLWLEQVPATVAAAGCQWLEGTSFVLDGVAVAGTIAWYDYSAVDPSVQASGPELAQQKLYYNADALRIDWEWADPELAERVSVPFLSQLDHLDGDPSVRRVVVATHVPIVEQQMHRDASDPRWAFSNAYFGNLTLGRKVLAHRKVSHIVSGHTHRGKQGTIERTDAPAVEVYVLASDYEKPAWLGLSIDTDV